MFALVRPALLAASLAASLAAGLAAATACASARRSGEPPAVSNGRELVRRMHDRYAGRWYSSLAFRQHNTAYAPHGEETSEWMEHQRVPGRLRIDFFPLAGKNGIIFRADTQYTFAAGKQTSARPLVHSLLVLSADVYANPVDTTLARLGTLAFDLDRVHTARLAGRRVYVVGAAPGDTAAAQFWVDADRLLVLRVIEPRPARDGHTALSDVRFTSYADVAGLPTPRDLVFRSDGRPVWKEEYTDVRVNAPVADDLFDPAAFAATQPPVP